MAQDKINFIILYQGRSGSTFLVDSLNQHPHIKAEYEILVSLRYLIKPNEELGPIKKVYTMALRFWQGSPAERQLKRVTDLYDNPPREAKVVGFKTKVRDIEAPIEMKELLESRRVKVILMERKNFVKKAVAYIYAFRLYDKIRDWHLLDEQDRIPPQYISFEEFDPMLRRMIYEHRTLHAYVDYLNTPKLRLEYDDLLKDKNGWFKSIFDFLGVEPQNLTSRILPNDPDDLRQAISNFDELKLHYIGTKFEAMFDEITHSPAQTALLEKAY